MIRAFVRFAVYAALFSSLTIFMVILLISWSEK
jgi:hypothetical protein